MSGYIKIYKTLLDDPRTVTMAKRLRNADVTCDTVRDLSHYVLLIIGAMVKFWVYCDTHIEDTNRLAVGPNDINEIIGLQGFCDLVPRDWLQIIDAEHVHLPNYLEHNGSVARRREEGKIRQRRYRSTVTNVTCDTVPTVTPPSQNIPIPIPYPCKKKKAQKTKSTFIASEIAGLDQEAWRRWLEYRQARQPALKPASYATAAKQMARLGAGQMAAVENSIGNGYTGLFPPRTNGAATAGPAPFTHAAEWAEIRALAKSIGYREELPGESLDAYRYAVRAAANPPKRAAPRPLPDIGALAEKLRAQS